jgi:hypothetical protein
LLDEARLARKEVGRPGVDVVHPRNGKWPGVCAGRCMRVDVAGLTAKLSVRTLAG